MIFYAVEIIDNEQKNQNNEVFYIPESAKPYGVYVYLIEYCNANEAIASDAAEWCKNAKIGEVFTSDSFAIKIVNDDEFKIER